jgi:hypothetical protein
MWKDPIVEEIRGIRKKLEKAYGSDSDAYLKHVYEQQKKSKIKLVSRSPQKKPLKKVA